MAQQQRATAGDASRIAPAQDDDLAERLFGLAAWLTMSAVALAYVVMWGRNLPYQDDWELVPVLTGQVPWTFSWLLDQTMEHRYVLGRALLYPIFKLGGSDYRAPMLCDVLLLSGIAFAALRTAWHVRGKAAFADAVLPILLLHLGHGENLIFFVQLYFVLPSCLLMVALFLLVRESWRQRGGAIALAAITVAMPLCGGMGLLWLPALAAWLLMAAYAQRAQRDGVSRLFLGAVIVAIVEAALVCVHLVFPEHFGQFPRTPARVLGTALEVLSVSFGPPTAPLYGFGALVAVVAAAAALSLMRRASRTADLRAWGLVAVIATGALVAFGIGWGRSVMGPGNGAASRYVLLTVPATCALYYAAALYGGALLGRTAQTAMLCFACALLPLNATTGLAYARSRAAAADALVRDVRAELPVPALAQRYTPSIYPNYEVLAAQLEGLRAAQEGPYRGLPPPRAARACRAVALAPASATQTFDLAADATGWRSLGEDPNLVFELAQPQRVCAVRIDYAVEHAGDGPVIGQLYWADTSRGTDFVEAERNTTWLAAAGRHSETVWIYATINRFRFDPDKQPGHVRIDALSLLVEE